MNKVTQTFDSIWLTTPDFKFRVNRNTTTWSGNITEATANNLEKFINDEKNGKTLGDRFEKLKDENVLKPLIVQSTKEIKIGDSVNLLYGKGKTLVGVIEKIDKNNAHVKTSMGMVKVQKAILLS